MRIAFKYKIIIGIVLIELVFLSFIIFYNYNSIQKFTKDLIQNNIKTNEILLKEMIKTPIMVYDLATIDNMLEKFINLEDIDSVKVYDSRNKLLSSYNENKHIHVDDGFHEVVRFNLIEDDVYIGYVEMIFDLNTIYLKIDENTRAIIQIAIIEIILSILFSYLFGRKLTEHLSILDDAVKNVTISNTNIKNLDIKSNDEFEDLAKSFNIMQSRIQNEIKKNTKQHIQLLEQSKLASMGEMIGNIAHQWRQPLSVISSGSTGIILQKKINILNDEQLIETCELINNNAQYLSKTIDDFRNFIKNDRNKVKFNLIDTFDTFFKLVEGTIISNNIKIVKSINSIDLEGFPNELIQCFMNIFNNSKDALKNIKDIHRFIFIDAYMKNNKIYISFKDNAGGINDDIFPYIFEPYFTTKHKSKGTGLGLSMTYNLITEGMNGTLNAKNSKFIYNELEYKGAEFTIILGVNS